MTAVVPARTGVPAVGDVVGPLSMFLSLQRLIMVSGANRDFAMSHVDNEAARAGGAESVLGDVGIGKDEVARLRDEGVVGRKP